MKISLIKIFVSRTPFLSSYFKMSCDLEIQLGDSGSCTVMSHLRMGWLKGLSNDLLSKSHPCFLTNNYKKQVKKPPNQLVHLWAADLRSWGVEEDELCSMMLLVWSQWMFHSPDVLIVTFFKALHVVLLMQLSMMSVRVQ